MSLTGHPRHPLRAVLRCGGYVPAQRLIGTRVGAPMADRSPRERG